MLTDVGPVDLLAKDLPILHMKKPGQVRLCQAVKDERVMLLGLGGLLLVVLLKGTNMRKLLRKHKAKKKRLDTRARERMSE